MAQREAVIFDQDSAAFANDDFRIFHFKVCYTASGQAVGAVDRFA